LKGRTLARSIQPRLTIDKLSRFVPQRENANRHTERGMAMLEESMRSNGFFDGMTAAADGEIIDGSARIEKSALIFADEAIVVEHDGTRPIVEVRTDIPDASDPRAKQIALAANRVAQVNLKFDPQMLKRLGEEIDFAPLWTKEELQEALAEEEIPAVLLEEDPGPQIDKAEELREKWQVEPGQLWQLGEHRLLCGDSAKQEDVDRVMRGEKADLMFTDPPYGVSIGAKNRMLNSFQPSGRNFHDIEADDMNAEDLKKMLIAVFTTARHFLSDRCSVFVCAPQNGSLGMMMMMMMAESGLPVRHVLNWVKNAPTFSMGRLDYEYQHEPILYTWTKTHKRIDAGQFHTSVWTVDKPRKSAEHPTMKPVDLPVNAILNHTEVGDFCYEPFSGSGTMIVACEQTKRNCCAIEISPAYVAVALQRWADMTGKEPQLL
jgi:DNA modification methylase